MKKRNKNVLLKQNLLLNNSLILMKISLKKGLNRRLKGQQTLNYNLNQITN